MAGIYAADVYCDDCIDSIKRRIADELWDNGNLTTLPDGDTNEDFEDCDELFDHLEGMEERHYDSGDYPKWCDDDEESDCPQHCGSHAECLNYGELSDGFKYGYCFGNSLTSEGVEYVKEAYREGEDGGVAREVWAVEYDWIDFECDRFGQGISCDCDDCRESQESLEDDFCDDEPEDGDYIVAPTGPLGSETALSIVGRSCMGVFDSDDEAISAARAKMDKDLFWPNIWYCSDHGNISLWED